MLTKMIARMFMLTAEVATLRALVQLQGKALEKSTHRSDRLSDDLEVARRELRDAVEEIETTNRAHAEERGRWAARVAELVAEADKANAELRELHKGNDRLESVVRMLEGERNHWKARAIGAPSEASS